MSDILENKLEKLKKKDLVYMVMRTRVDYENMKAMYENRMKEIDMLKEMCMDMRNKVANDLFNQNRLDVMNARMVLRECPRCGYRS